jgi:hypothetical protein
MNIADDSFSKILKSFGDVSCPLLQVLKLRKSYCTTLTFISEYSRLLSRNAKVKIYKTIILPVVLYGCETWSVTLREEHRLRVFENRVLR